MNDSATKQITISSRRFRFYLLLAFTVPVAVFAIEWLEAYNLKHNGHEEYAIAGYTREVKSHKGQYYTVQGLYCNGHEKEFEVDFTAEMSALSSGALIPVLQSSSDPEQFLPGTKKTPVYKIAHFNSFRRISFLLLISMLAVAIGMLPVWIISTKWRWLKERLDHGDMIQFSSHRTGLAGSLTFIAGIGIMFLEIPFPPDTPEQELGKEAIFNVANMYLYQLSPHQLMLHTSGKYETFESDEFNTDSYCYFHSGAPKDLQLKRLGYLAFRKDNTLTIKTFLDGDSRVNTFTFRASRIPAIEISRTENLLTFFIGDTYYYIRGNSLETEPYETGAKKAYMKKLMMY